VTDCPLQARDVEVIRRRVLEKVLTFTTKSFDEDSDGSDTAENTDPEIITAPASDADSSGDSKVVAKSIEGEEDLVSVDMAAKSVEHRPSTARGRQPLLLKRFKTRRPTLLNSQSFLAPELQNLFDLSYFHEGNPLPTGWNEVSEDANLPKLSDRLPKDAASDIDMQSPSNPNDELDSSEDGDISDQLPQAAFTSMAGDEADESDDTDLPAVSVCCTRHPCHFKPPKLTADRTLRHAHLPSDS
jgi:ubiquitin carboxyl-terminal hydrolase 4/11